MGRVVTLKEAIKAKPTFPLSHNILGAIYFNQGKKELARMELQQTLKLDPGIIFAHRLLGRIYADDIKTDQSNDNAVKKAIKSYKEVQQAMPEDIEAKRMLILLYNHMGLFEISLFEAKKALGKEKNAENYQSVGSAYLRLGDHEKARHFLQKAIELNPDSIETHYSLACYYAIQNQYSEAIDELDYVINNSNQDHRYYTFRGRIWGKLKNTKNAIIDFSKAIDINPSDPEAYIERGLAYLETRDFNLSISDLKTAVSIDPENPMGPINLGFAYRNAGFYDEAISQYDKAIEFHPSDYLAYSNRSFVFLLKKDYEHAMADCNKAIEINPYFGMAYSNRGRIKAILNDTGGVTVALAAIPLKIAIAPSSPT